MEIILASASKRRHELMKVLNVPFKVIVSTDEEVYDKKKNLYEQCMDISYHKALNVYHNTDLDRVVIGADTVVIFEDKIYGKPKNKDDAYNMLKKLSGKMHEVVTGYIIIVFKDNQYSEEKSYVVTKVYFDELSDYEIMDWINNHDACDMAGGYGIQEGFSKYVKKIDGDYFNVVGFPVNAIYQSLKKYL